MPKAVFKIAEFEGGENRVSNPRDLELNESALAKGVEFDNIGRVRVAGNGKEVTAITLPESVVLKLFSYRNRKPRL